MSDSESIFMSIDPTYLTAQTIYIFYQMDLDPLPAGSYFYPNPDPFLMSMIPNITYRKSTHISQEWSGSAPAAS